MWKEEFEEMTKILEEKIAVTSEIDIDDLERELKKHKDARISYKITKDGRDNFIYITNSKSKIVAEYFVFYAGETVGGYRIQEKNKNSNYQNKLKYGKNTGF